MPEDGFTLLEVIVALVVLGFVLTGLAQATRFGISAWGLETRMADNSASLERVDRVLRNIIEQASPPTAGDDKPFTGQEHQLVFMTLLPDQPETQQFRRAQVSVGVDDHHQLVLRWQLHPVAILVGEQRPMQEVVLVDGIERIDLAYRQAASDGGKWSKTWAALTLPSVVQIHFVLSSSHRRWPDMQVPTLLDSNGSF